MNSLMRAGIALLMAGGAATAAHAADDQFDLNCTGLLKGFEGKGLMRLHQPDKPVTQHYRVDLASNHWCVGDKCAVQPFAEIRSDLLSFERRDASFIGDAMLLNTVDRTTGKWTVIAEPAHVRIEGTCERAPFTGFPSAETKF